MTRGKPQGTLGLTYQAHDGTPEESLSMRFDRIRKCHPVLTHSGSVSLGDLVWGHGDISFVVAAVARCGCLVATMRRQDASNDRWLCSHDLDVRVSSHGDVDVNSLIA